MPGGGEREGSFPPALPAAGAGALEQRKVYLKPLLERQSGCLDPKSLKVLDMMNTAHSSQPPGSPSRV